jgi:hypothetical protein
VEVLTASSNGDIDVAFAGLAQRRIDALVIAPDTLFTNRVSQLATPWPRTIESPQAIGRENIRKSAG